jgi:hypothetical protein
LNAVLFALVQFLVHVLAALALMGLGCLWQLMNASANFAHARRDMREAPGRNDPAQFLTGVSDCTAPAGNTIMMAHVSSYIPPHSALPC